MLAEVEGFQDQRTVQSPGNPGDLGCCIANGGQALIAGLAALRQRDPTAVLAQRVAIPLNPGPGQVIDVEIDANGAGENIRPAPRIKLALAPERRDEARVNHAEKVMP